MPGQSVQLKLNTNSRNPRITTMLERFAREDIEIGQKKRHLIANECHHTTTMSPVIGYRILNFGDVDLIIRFE